MFEGGSWVIVDDKLTIDKEKYRSDSHGFRLAKIFDNPKRWDVVFQHKSGRIAILLDEVKLNDGTFPLLQLMTNENEIVFEPVTDLMFEWKIISMIDRKFNEKFENSVEEKQHSCNDKRGDNFSPS